MFGWLAKLSLRSPYLWGAIAVGLLTLFGYAYQLGADHAADSCQAEQLKAVAAAVEEEKARTERVREKLKTHLAAAQLIKQRNQMLEREVYHYAQSHIDSGCRLDADFVRIWNLANRGEQTEQAATGAGAGLRRSADAIRRRFDGGAAQSRTDSPYVPPVSGASPGPSGVGQ